MVTLTIVSGAAILLGTLFIARAIGRVAVVLESDSARRHDAAKTLKLSLDCGAVASIAGTLLAARVNSSAYDTERRDARANVSGDSQTALVSPALSDLGAEVRRAKVDEVLFEREREKCIAVARGVFETMRKEFQGV
ncbi:MAG: hypothetical protein AABO58_08340 [Acidobacteriota bacterium]